MENKTTIKCYLTSCKYNNSCCIAPFNDECYCTKDEITIDIDKEDRYSLNFECVNFENGNKKNKCLDCQEEENDGDIPLDDEEIELTITDFDDDDSDW